MITLNLCPRQYQGLLLILEHVKDNSKSFPFIQKESEDLLNEISPESDRSKGKIGKRDL